MEEIGSESKGQLGFQNLNVYLASGRDHSRGSLPTVLCISTGVWVCSLVVFCYLPLFPICPLILKDHVREGPIFLGGMES